MDEISILVPDKTPIMIGDRKYFIGKLSLKQVIVLSKMISKTLLLNIKRFSAYKDKLANVETTNAQDIYNMMELLDETEIIQLFGILLKEEDTKYLEDNLDLITTTDIIVKFLEANEWIIVKKNFQTISKMFQQEKKEEKN
jgi:hypothetical protein